VETMLWQSQHIEEVVGRDTSVFQTLKDAWSSFEHDTRLFTASANQIKAVWEALAFSDKVKQAFVSVRRFYFVFV